MKRCSSASIPGCAGQRVCARSGARAGARGAPRAGAGSRTLAGPTAPLLLCRDRPAPARLERLRDRRAPVAREGGRSRARAVGTAQRHRPAQASRADPRAGRLASAFELPRPAAADLGVILTQGRGADLAQAARDLAREAQKDSRWEPRGQGSERCSIGSLCSSNPRAQDPSAERCSIERLAKPASCWTRTLRAIHGVHERVDRAARAVWQVSAFVSGDAAKTDAAGSSDGGMSSAAIQALRG